MDRDDVKHRLGPGVAAAPTEVSSRKTIRKLWLDPSTDASLIVGQVERLVPQTTPVPSPLVNRNFPIAQSQQPGFRLRNRRRQKRTRGQDWLNEAVKPSCRTAGIDARKRIALAARVPPITQHVDEHPSDLTGGPQYSFVVPIRPDGSSKAVRAIKPARHSNHEAANTSRKRRLIARFANEMHVIRLDTVVHDSATESLSGRCDGCDEPAPRLGKPQRR